MSLTLSPPTVAILTGTVIPIVTSVLTKAKASAKVKMAVNIVVTVVAFVIANAVVPATGEAVFSWKSLSDILLAAVVSGQAYDKFWKPFFEINDRLVPNVGFGKPLEESPAPEG